MRIQRQLTRTRPQPGDSPDLEQLRQLLADQPTDSSKLIPLLQATQQMYGYIPGQAFAMISEATGVPVSDIYGVATFYAQFRLKPVGKHIVKVCHGTACHVQNANAITDALKEALQIEENETTPDGMFTLESVACLGCCSLAPVMMVGDETHGKLTGKTATRIIKDMKNDTCRKQQ
ncbi:MAG: NADH-quinone oxidoreductase subunit NuoE [Bacteroidetes bacterium]|nr:NADH-quinone oxidoreductase subunit NuoE [Bacteroidota bacterium]